MSGSCLRPLRPLHRPGPSHPPPLTHIRPTSTHPTATLCRYVDKAFAKAGTALKVDVRSRQNDATVTKMPFVPTHYHKP